VRALADGRVFTGQEAKELGLVDAMGNFNDALERAGRLGGNWRVYVQR
jgi:protease-4